MKPPRKFLCFELWTLNRVFRALGFVLVITTDSEKPTTLHFTGRRRYDEFSAYCQRKRLGREPERAEEVD
jgi:hypothetical protein